MEKFFKSFFTPEKKKNVFEDITEEENSDFSPPSPGGARRTTTTTTTISRSGRMRHSNKKRHSLSLQVYGDTNQTVEKPKSLEYHVNKVVSESRTQRKRSEEPAGGGGGRGVPRDKAPRRGSAGSGNTPEEEIDRAFEVLDKTL